MVHRGVSNSKAKVTLANFRERLKLTPDNRPTDTAPRVLIFNHISNQRDALSVLEHLAKALELVEIQHVIIPDYGAPRLFDSSSKGE